MRDKYSTKNKKNEKERRKKKKKTLRQRSKVLKRVSGVSIVFTIIGVVRATQCDETGNSRRKSGRRVKRRKKKRIAAQNDFGADPERARRTNLNAYKLYGTVCATLGIDTSTRLTRCLLTYGKPGDLQKIVRRYRIIIESVTR